VRVIADCDCVVAGRYHSLLLPLLLGIPAVGLAYNAKTTELFAAVDHPERCLDIDLFDVSSLVAVFRSIGAPESPETREAQRARAAGHRRTVEEQFERLFAVESRFRRARAHEWLSRRT
jgi:polysaccharide pyruvyl transferase WcaK-like protein